MSSIEQLPSEKCYCRCCRAWAVLGFNGCSGPLFYAVVGSLITIGFVVLLPRIA